MAASPGVEKPSEGALGIGVAVLASFEALLPLFDGDERRTILYLQHAMGEVLTRAYELAFKTLSEREHPPRQDRQGARRHRSTAPAGTSTTSDPSPDCSR